MGIVRDRAWGEVTAVESGRAPEPLATALAAGQEAHDLLEGGNARSVSYEAPETFDDVLLEAGRSDLTIPMGGWREAEHLRLAGRLEDAASILVTLTEKGTRAEVSDIAVSALVEADLGHFDSARKLLQRLEDRSDERSPIPRLRPAAVRAYLEKRASK
jgi:hypothetical protein